MDYKIFVSKEGPWIELTLLSPITSDLIKIFSTELSKVAAKHRLGKTLVDVSRVSNTTDTLNQYNFAYSHVEKIGVPRSLPIAILTAPGDSSHDLIETMLKNAGFFFKKFDDRQLAIDWLMSKPNMKP